MYNILSFVTLDFRYTGKISSGVKVHNDNDRSRKCPVFLARVLVGGIFAWPKLEA